MSFLDRVTKAVGDAVERGKREVDQFVQIQKINSQIGDIERTIGESRTRIQQNTSKIGETAVEMLRAGKIDSPGMKALLDEIDGTERFIKAEEARIAEKRAEIERIKAEDDRAETPGTPAVEPQPPPPPPIPTAATARPCPQCGAPAAERVAFCSQCGARLA